MKPLNEINKYTDERSFISFCLLFCFHYSWLCLNLFRHGKARVSNWKESEKKMDLKGTSVICRDLTTTINDMDLRQIIGLIVGLIVLTFFLSLIDPLPLTMILHPVSCSSCLAVIPRGPNILPTKLNCK